MMRFLTITVVALVLLLKRSNVDGAAAARQLEEFEMLADYQPTSGVADQSALDLDQEAIRTELGFARAANFINAEHFYTDGAFSGTYAEITIAGGISTRAPKGTVVTGVNVSGGTVSGTLMDSVGYGETTVRVLYTILTNADEIQCDVGALKHSGFTHTEGCLRAEGKINILTDYQYKYDITQDNKNERTIQKLSSKAETEMLLCDECPHRTFKKFFDYYNVPDYGDRWVMAAFQKTKTQLARGNADFRDYVNIGRAEAVRRGTVNLSVWMYVIRKMEEALDLCVTGSDQTLSSWDEAVAYYTGSVNGQDKQGNGLFLYSLADHRCAEFKTCGDSGSELEGHAAVNLEIFRQFDQGKIVLDGNSDCKAAEAIKVKIEDMMAIPLVQGALRYAYTRSYQQENEQNQAIGATFAAAVLPLVHACNSDDAYTIEKNLRVGSETPNFMDVKKAFERNYKCMGITCSDVGGFFDTANNQYLEDAFPCNESVGGNKTKHAIIQGVFFSLLLPLSIVVAGVWHLRQKRQTFDEEERLKSNSQLSIYPPSHPFA